MTPTQGLYQRLLRRNHEEKNPIQGDSTAHIVYCVCYATVFLSHSLSLSNYPINIHNKM